MQQHEIKPLSLTFHFYFFKVRLKDESVETVLPKQKELTYFISVVQPRKQNDFPKYSP